MTESRLLRSEWGAISATLAALDLDGSVPVGSDPHDLVELVAVIPPPLGSGERDGADLELVIGYEAQFASAIDG